MSDNVISLSQHFKSRPKINGLGSLAQSFSSYRRGHNDVYWLKENAEFLSIVECTNQTLEPHDLDSYAAFYETLTDRIAFFPQYYRFLTSIALDLESLGMDGNVAEHACHFVDTHALAKAELSDLQRGEAMRLLQRRGVHTQGADELRARLHAFMDHTASFAIPNRKAAYELTHIVFYLSEYGRCDPELSERACQSLMFTGILAHLEENADLLSEVCVALRYAGKIPPKAWEQWISQVVTGFDRALGSDPSQPDHYHEFLVANWAKAQMGGAAFDGTYDNIGQAFFSPVNPLGAMSAVSQALFDLNGARQSSWDVMQSPLTQSLSDPVAQHLGDVVGASSEFGTFFEQFARPSTPNGIVNLAQSPHKQGRVQ